MNDDNFLWNFGAMWALVAFNVIQILIIQAPERKSLRQLRRPPRLPVGTWAEAIKQRSAA